jgi:uncharacterized protein
MAQSFGKFSEEHLSKMEEAIHLFNEQKYWECHEALEDLWMEDRNDPVRNVYWAIIQVAASCIHYRDGNLVGAQGMLNKAREKFHRCRELNVLTNIVLECLDWEKLERLVFAVKESDAKLDDFRPIFEFRFINYLRV